MIGHEHASDPDVSGAYRRAANRSSCSTALPRSPPAPSALPRARWSCPAMCPRTALRDRRALGRRAKVPDLPRGRRRRRAGRPGQRRADLRAAGGAAGGRAACVTAGGKTGDPTAGGSRVPMNTEGALPEHTPS